MKQRFMRAVFATLLWLLPHQAFSQSTDAGITVVGLASFQPGDDTYVGGPYLDGGAIGGVGPGVGVGANLIFSTGFLLAAEYTTAWFEREQGGRLVDGIYGGGGPHTTVLHDSLLSGLIGYATSGGQTRVQILGGLSAKLDVPTVDDVSRDEAFSTVDDEFPWVITSGVDVRREMSNRVALVVGARYSFIDRRTSYQYLGIGPHVLRATVGLRLRVN